MLTAEDQAGAVALLKNLANTLESGGTLLELSFNQEIARSDEFPFAKSSAPTGVKTLVIKWREPNARGVPEGWLVIAEPGCQKDELSPRARTNNEYEFNEEEG